MNVEITSYVDIDELARHFDVLFKCNFDRRIIDIILIYFIDIISMDEKSMHFWRTSFDMFLKGKNRDRFNVPFW